MDEKVEFQGNVIFQKEVWVKNLQYRYVLQTSTTHWRKIAQPASSPEPNDETLDTNMEFLRLEEKMGIDKVTQEDHIAAILMDNWFGRLLNKVRRNKVPFENVGVLLHPNRLLK